MRIREASETWLDALVSALPSLAAVLVFPPFALATAPLGLWFAWRDGERRAFQVIAGLFAVALLWLLLAGAVDGPGTVLGTP